MDSISLLEMLKDEFLDSSGYVRRKVDVNRCLQLVGEIMASLPQCIGEAQKIIADREKILSNADSVAQNTISTAEQQARHLISGSEVGHIAEQEAKKIVYKAQIQRDVLIDKTKSHLEKMFDETEQFLMGLIGMIRTNRKELRAVVFR